MIISFGSIIVLALVIGVIIIGAKVRNNAQKLQELKSNLSKE